MNTFVQENSGSRSLSFRNFAVPIGKEEKSADMPLEVEPSAIFVIDKHALGRECLAQSLHTHRLDVPIVTLSSLEQLVRRGLNRTASVVLINIGDQKVSEPSIGNYLSKAVTDCAPAPVVVLADKEDISQILKALEYGVRGYIPTSVSINVCVEALRLTMAGGTFVPASSVLAMRNSSQDGLQEPKPMGGLFTLRQAEVVNALRRGKANKIIAYELNLRESTVKVHIRNIMKKLKASNRTEVACMINDLFPTESASSQMD